MSNAGTSIDIPEPAASVGTCDMKLEVVTLPVSDVDRAKAFYVDKVGFTADQDHQVTDELRFVQLTPPGSEQTNWTETILHNFQFSASGRTPIGELVSDANGHLFGVSYAGGASGVGAVFEITP